jgi:hypothetical protein
MRLTQFLAAAAAFSLAAAPAVAAPENPAAALSLAGQDTAADPAATAPMKARNSTYLLAGLGVVAVIIAAVAMGGNGDSSPASS